MIGVDTHRDEHVIAVVSAPAGAVVARRAIGAEGRGYRDALRFAEQVAAGRRAWAIAGSGSYGAGLARSLSEQGEAVLEIGRTARSERRLAGKDDLLDAVRIARAALASDKLALPRSGERREALRLLLIARRSAVDVRREALVQLRSLPASSGQTTRHRLSRGGDRQLNRALHTIILHRRQHDPATRDYIARRVSEGKSTRDATRLLKRYFARHLYRLLEQQPQMT